MQSEPSPPRRDASTEGRLGGGEVLTPLPEYRPAGGLRPGSADEAHAAAASGVASAPLGRTRLRRFVAASSALACAGALMMGTVLPASGAASSSALAEAGAAQLMSTGSTSGGPGFELSEPLPLVQTAPKAAATASAAVGAAGLKDTKLRYPFDSEVKLTDGFGYRTAPVAEFHDGQDLAPSAGTPIRIIGDGVVSEAGFASDGCGFGLKVEHRVAGQSVSSRYCHMEADSHELEVGDPVKSGDLAGRVGATGTAFGAHLHLVIQLEDESIDPLPFIELHSE